MSQNAPQNPICQRSVVYELPGAEAVRVRRDVEFRAAGGPLAMDLYEPPGPPAAAPTPAMIIVAGYPDAGFQKVVGCRFKEMQSSISWGRLIAASGIVAITYTNREPVGDLHALIEHIRRNSAPLGIDEDTLGVWASSGNVPLALSLLAGDARKYLKCAVLCYGYTLDLDGAGGVAEAAKRFGFCNPCAGRSVQDLAKEVPLFAARAGLDAMPWLNAALDVFLSRALACNLPITFANHPEAPHAFDLFHDSAVSREIIREILAFLRFNLLGSAGSDAG